MNEHAIPGSALFVLRDALLREVKRQASRTRRRSKHTKLIAQRELDAAIALARDAGCAEDEIQKRTEPARRQRHVVRRR